MSTLVLGGGAAVVAVMANQLLLFFLAEIMILSGGGDFLIALKILLYRTNKKESVVSKFCPSAWHVPMGIHSLAECFSSTKYSRIETLNFLKKAAASPLDIICQ